MKYTTRDIIQKYGLRLTKSLGQNFLNNEDIINSIVDAAKVDKTDLIIEVGPGIGSMTAALAAKAGKIIAVEIDKKLIGPLKDNLEGYDNVEIINADILETDVQKLISEKSSDVGGFKAERVKVVANLPYYITTPIIMSFLEQQAGIDTMVFMVQKEVAERMAASPGGKEYGALSVAVQYYSKPSRVMNVPPHVFIPQPDVESAVVKLSIYEKPPVEVYDKVMFFKVVKASFGQRRKTLVNALSNSGITGMSKEQLKELLLKKGIDEKQRGETLSILQFAELANSFLLKYR